MASGNWKNSWLIWLLVVVAVGLLGLSFIKKQGDEPQVTYAEVFPEDDHYDGSASSMAKAVAPMLEKAEVVVEEAAPVQEESKIESSKASVSKEMFSVQVYSFQEKKRADSALINLKNKGYDSAYTLMSDLGPKGIWHRVRVGSFETEDEAKEMLMKLRGDFNSGIIVRK